MITENKLLNATCRHTAVPGTCTTTAVHVHTYMYTYYLYTTGTYVYVYIHVHTTYIHVMYVPGTRSKCKNLNCYYTVTTVHTCMYVTYVVCMYVCNM